MTKKKTQTILVELDCLLDTRLGTLNRLDPAAVDRVLFSGKYHERESDEFDGVDMERYRALYVARNRETLMHSAPTNCFAFVREFVGMLRNQALELNNPMAGEIKIAVNLWPYQLSEEEVSEVGKSLAVRLGGVAPVELVYLSTADLTPDHVRNSYHTLVMYEYDPWLSMHYDIDPTKHSLKELMKRLLVDITLFSPAIYHRKPPDADTLAKLLKESTHPLIEAELLGGTIIGLHLVDVEFFSIVRSSQGIKP